MKKTKPPVDSDSYGTPDIVFNWLNKVFNFDVDAFASHTNAKCDRYYTKDNSALSAKKWNFRRGGRLTKVFMNPPYSRTNIYNCMQKAYEESLKGCIVVAIVRDDPSTRWYQEFIHGKAYKVIRLKERVKFIGGKDTYNFPCCVVLYDLTGFEQHGTEYLLRSYKEEFML